MSALLKPSLIFLIALCSAFTTMAATNESTSLSEWVDTSVNGSSTSARSHAIYELGRIEDPRVIDPLIAALKDRKTRVRKTAVHALKRKMDEDPKVIEALVEALSDKSADVRRESVVALGKSKDPRVAVPLSVALNDKSGYVRKAASDALQYRKDPRLVESLIAALNHKDRRVGRKAMIALGSNFHDDPRIIEPLLRVALEGRDSGTRNWAAIALEKLEGPVAVETQLILLNRGDSTRRQNAASQLGKLGDRQAVDPLIQVLQNGDDEPARDNAASALGKLGDPRAVEALIGALNDERSRVRSEAATALGALGDARAIQPLITTLGDEKNLPSLNAAKALIAIEPPTGDIIELLANPSPRVRELASRILGELSDAHAIEPLILVWRDDPELDVRDQAAKSLQKLSRQEEVQSTSETHALTVKVVVAGSEAASIDYQRAVQAEARDVAVELGLIVVGDGDSDLTITIVELAIGHAARSFIMPARTVRTSTNARGRLTVDDNAGHRFDAPFTSRNVGPSTCTLVHRAPAPGFYDRWQCRSAPGYISKGPTGLYSYGLGFRKTLGSLLGHLIVNRERVLGK